MMDAVPVPPFIPDASIIDRAQRFAHALLRHAPPVHPDAGFFAAVMIFGLTGGVLVGRQIQERARVRS